MLVAKHRSEIKTELLRQLNEQRSILAKAVQEAADATTHSEAKQEGKYDTRAIEASYLASAQADRLAELDQRILTLDNLDTSGDKSTDIVKISSLIYVKDDDERCKWYMVLPGVAGVSVQIESTTIMILSPESILGSELVGKSIEEDIELSIGGVTKTLTITMII